MASYSWLWESVWGRLPGPWADIVLALAAILCGILMGNERQRREKPAGLRTLLLVCLGSAVFTMASFNFTSTTGDSGRVAAQIVTGVGFLGAGVILHGRRFVSGVTTAAVIWVAAAIGMTVGSGYPLAGLALSVLVNGSMVLMQNFETRWDPELRDACVRLEYAPNAGLTRVRIERLLVDYEPLGIRADWEEGTNSLHRLTLTLRLAPVHLYELLAELADVPEVRSIARESPPQPSTPKKP